MAQAIRDLSSVDDSLVQNSTEWIISIDFNEFCERMELDVNNLRKSLMLILKSNKSEIKQVTEDTISSLRASLWQKKTRL